MRIASPIAAIAALGASLLITVSASPTVMSSLPDYLSEAVRRDIAQLPADQYTLFERHAGFSGRSLQGRDAPVNGLQTNCSQPNCLSITLDDGSYQWERKVVDTFDQAGGQKATFFVNGNNWRCIYDKDSVKDLRYAFKHGHQICSHTWSHPHLSTLTNEQLDRQVSLVEEALWKILGVVPACIRAPYGEITAKQIRHLNKKWNLVVVGWSHDTGDANGDGIQAGLDLYKNLKPPTQAIVLNHETVQGTVDTVIPQALKIVQQNGYKGSETVATTIGFNPYKAVRKGPRSKRDETWTCEGKPEPGNA